MERTELPDFVRLFRTYLNQTHTLGFWVHSNLSGIEPPTQLPHWVRVHGGGQGVGHMLLWAGQLCFPWSQTSPVTIAFNHRTNNCSKKKAGKSMWTEKKITVYLIPIKNARYDWQVSGIICEGQHLLHSRIFTKLTTKTDLILSGGYFHHAVIHKIEATEREASIKIHTG